MIDTAALKSRILEQAFRGNITKRYTDDENARILYTKLVNNNKISHIESVEELYEIPETWKWISLGNVGKWGAGATPSRKVKDYYGGDIPWLKTGDLNDGMITDIPEYITELALKETSVKLNPVGSVLIAMYGATIGKLGILEVEATTNQACCACSTYEGIYNKYLFYYLMSQRNRLRYMGSGGAQSNISKEKIVGYCFPLAPYAEQIRVVNAIETIFAELDKIEKLQLHYSVNLEILKSKIIDAGIQGKLTKQLPEDGTAEELLEQIAEEKKQLIKEKKIKATKALPEITEDEIPFEIPSNWKWVCLNNTGILQTGATPPKTNPDYFGNDIPFLSPGDIQDNTIVSYNNQGLSNLGIEKARVVDENSVLQVCIGGSIGKAAINDRKVTFNQQINSVTPILCEAKYLFYCMVSSHFMGKIQIASAGAATPIINKSKWGELLIPLPPLAEQKRIVEKITQILEQI